MKKQLENKVSRDDFKMQDYNNPKLPKYLKGGESNPKQTTN